MANDVSAEVVLLLSMAGAGQTWYHHLRQNSDSVGDSVIRNKAFKHVYTLGQRPPKAFKPSYIRQDLIRAPHALLGSSCPKPKGHSRP